MRRLLAILSLGAIACTPSHRAPEMPTLVGTRTQEPSLAFALHVAGGFGVRFDTTTGPELIERARTEHRFVSDPRPGDLVVFENGAAFGVVSQVEDGTVEFLYAQRRVVRRGLVTPRAPDRKRDERGRALNTFVRPYTPGDPPEQRYLAGELLTGFIRGD